MSRITGLLSLLESNPVLNLTFLILALVSLLISIFFYVHSRREKRPCYNIVSYPLIRGFVGKIEGIEITYRSEPIKNLTFVFFAIWNRGRDTIHRSDLAPTDPIRLEVPQGNKIISPQIVFVAEKANNFTLSVDPTQGSLIIDFDYFHTAEGIALQFYHTAPDEKHLTIRGTVKGAKLTNFTDREFPAFQSVMDFSGASKLLDKIARRFSPVPDSLVAFTIILPLIPFLIPAMVFDIVSAVSRRVPRQFDLRI